MSCLSGVLDFLNLMMPMPSMVVMKSSIAIAQHQQRLATVTTQLLELQMKVLVTMQMQASTYKQETPKVTLMLM